MQAAWGIYAIVNENMAQAARRHVIERNRDPRDLTMVAFGGAGPMHAVSIARTLGVSTIVVPLGAGVASAIGALTAPISLPFARTYMTWLDACDWSVVRRLYQEMQEEAIRACGRRDESRNTIQFRRSVDLRFEGQFHELHIDLPSQADSAGAADLLASDFREQYAQFYGRVPSGLRVEVLNWHLVAELPRWKFTLAGRLLQPSKPQDALKGRREVYFGGPRPTGRSWAVYDRYRLEPGTQVDGPCIIEERESTAVVPAGSRASVDAYQNLIVHVGQRAAGG
jgi:N-methylhydantoinase A/oxoprolinase/acetone carboxylase beta subunit